MFNIAVKIAILSTFPIHYLIPTYMLMHAPGLDLHSIVQKLVGQLEE